MVSTRILLIDIVKIKTAFRNGAAGVVYANGYVVLSPVPLAELVRRSCRLSPADAQQSQGVMERIRT